MTQQRNPNEQDRSIDTPSPKRRWRLSRRGFLIGLGAAGAGLAVGAYFGKPALNLFMAESLAAGEHAGNSFMQLADDPPLWLEVLPDSRIRLSLVKVEMGQGVHTSIAQIAVEELGIGWGRSGCAAGGHFIRSGGQFRHWRQLLGGLQLWSSAPRSRGHAQSAAAGSGLGLEAGGGRAAR